VCGSATNGEICPKCRKLAKKGTIYFRAMVRNEKTGLFEDFNDFKKAKEWLESQKEFTSVFVDFIKHERIVDRIFYRRKGATK
jgi:hypothetical protein